MVSVRRATNAETAERRVQLQRALPGAAAAPLEVTLIQSGLRMIHPVQFAHRALNAPMAVILQQMPGEFGIVIPFRRLPEFTAHEQQFFSGMAPHEAEIGAQIGKSLPVITRHAAEQGILAVHHFVM